MLRFRLILLSFCLLGGFSLPVQAAVCKKAITELTADVADKPLIKLRSKIAQQIREAPRDLFSKTKKISKQLGECFNSPKLTLKQRRAAKTNFAMNLLVPTTAIVGSHAYSVQHAEKNNLKAPDFPFDLMATVIVLYTWQSLIQCQNEMLPAKNPNAGFLKRSWDKYLPYLKMDLAGVGVYVGAITLEDMIRGNEISPSELAGEGAFGLGWDLGMSAAHVVLLDKVLMRYLPGGRVWLSEMIKKRALTKSVSNRGSRKVLFLTSEKWAEVPGLFLEFMLRQGYISTRSFAFVQLRNSLFSKELDEDEDQDDKESVDEPIIDKPAMDQP